MSLIAQYIENYLDLIENSPNEIVRQITRLHEKNHVYSKLQGKLEEMLKILVDDGSKENVKEERTKVFKCEKTTDCAQVTSERPSSDKPNEMLSSETEKSNLKSTEIQPDKQASFDKSSASSSDQNKQSNKTTIEDDEEKVSARKVKALNSVKRYLLEIQEIADEKLSIVQSILEHLDCKNKQLDLDYRSLSSQSVNSNSKSNSNSSSQNTNDEDSLSGNQENSNNELNYQKEERQSNPVQSSSQQSSSVNNHHSSSNSKRASSRRNLSTTTSNKPEFSSSNDLHTSHNNGNNNSANSNTTNHNNSNNNGNSSSNHQHKRGVKRGGGVNKGSNKEMKRNRSSSTKDMANSPSNLYDETPIDPDEPTYCICEKVSFGEMICCDNAACDIEWFHFSCVSLTTKPKGKWYCPNCRGDRSNLPRSMSKK